MDTGGKVYEGCMVDDEVVVQVDGRPLDKQHRYKVHHDEFDWGGDTPGAAQLALAIVADASSPADAVIIHHEFKHMVVKRWKRGEPWKITQKEVLQRIGRHYP